MSNKEDKKFTWEDLKKSINRISEKHLKKEVIIWTGDERCYKIIAVEILKEDHLFDGDDGCCPRSQMKETINEEKKEFPDTASEYYLIHEKGTRILWGE